MLQYLAIVSTLNDYWFVEFPDLPGCRFYLHRASGYATLISKAEDNLATWMEGRLCEPGVPAPPTADIATDSLVLRVKVPRQLEALIKIRQKNQ